MQQVLFRLPIGQNGIPINGFGAMLFCAFVACIWMATRRARQVGIAPEVIQDLALWLFGGGIIGARTAFMVLFDPPESFWDYFVKLIRIWDGGIILYGGIIGALISYFIGYFVSLRFRENVTTMRLADVVAPTVAVGLILGRFGCFLNGCCYGQVVCSDVPALSFPMSAPARYDLTSAGFQTAAGFLVDSRTARVTHVQPGSAAAQFDLRAGDVIVAVNGRTNVVERDGDNEATYELPSIDALNRLLVGYWPRGANDLTLVVRRGEEEKTLSTFQPRTLELQPTQLYESVSMVLVLLILLAFDRVKRREGQGVALLMICYGVHRFVNEKLRIDVRPVGFESYISVFLVVAGITMMIWLAMRPPTIVPAPLPEPEAPRPTNPVPSPVPQTSSV